MTNKYQYEIKCSETVFTRYIDDMSLLFLTIYDAKRQETVGVSRIALKLYVRRSKNPNNVTLPLLEIWESFPILSPGDMNLKIGEFGISMVAVFDNKDIVSRIQNEAFLKGEVMMK